jgi:hypothetical protein
VGAPERITDRSIHSNISLTRNSLWTGTIPCTSGLRLAAGQAAGLKFRGTETELTASLATKAVHVVASGEFLVRIAILPARARNASRRRLLPSDQRSSFGPARGVVSRGGESIFQPPNQREALLPNPDRAARLVSTETATSRLQHLDICSCPVLSVEAECSAPELRPRWLSPRSKEPTRRPELYSEGLYLIRSNMVKRPTRGCLVTSSRRASRSSRTVSIQSAASD